MIVAGATGFAGALAAHLLWRHPGFELVGVTGRSEQGRRAGGPLPALPRAARDRGARRSTAPGADVDAAIVAYPHAAAAPTVAALRERGVRVVDLSADFRLRSLETYEHWYGRAPAARADRRRPSTGSPSFTASAIARRAHRRQPRLLPDRVAAGARAARARGR